MNIQKEKINKLTINQLLEMVKHHHILKDAKKIKTRNSLFVYHKFVGTHMCYYKTSDNKTTGHIKTKCPKQAKNFIKFITMCDAELYRKIKEEF